MNELKTYYSAQELVDLCLQNLPTTKKAVITKAKREHWQSRKRTGRGGGLEYELASMPQAIQQQIKLKLALAEPTPQPDTAPKASLATLLNNASEKARQQATHKAEAVRQVQRRMDVGIGLMQAIEQVSQEFNVASGSLKNWFYKVQGYHIHEWAMVLLKQTGKKAKAHQKAFIEQEAWEVFLTDYLRPEQPSFAACYRRTAELANEMGWEIASKQTFQRKLATEVPYEAVVYQRQGANAVAKLVPALRRSVKDLFVMEWLNGDGYQHNVFVRFPNGEINRPKTWFWQDVKSRRIVG